MDDDDKLKQFPIRNNEIDVLVKLLRHAVPELSDQDLVFNLVQRLLIIRRL